MAYRFRLHEAIQHGVRRIATEQLDKTLVAPEPTGRAVWVHETRKSLKRVRALLRLVRSGIGADVWRTENGRLRDIARSLSGMRDTDVLDHTMARLDDAGGKALRASLTWARKRLAHRLPSDAASADEAAAAAVTQALADLAEARDRLGEIDVDGAMADVLSAGIRSARRRARRALAAAVAEEAGPEGLHELRKAVQAHWRHMKLVQAAWPELHLARAGAAQQLSQLLGDVQDLEVLAARLKELAHSDVERRHARRLAAACTEQQAALCAIAMPGAARLFAAPGKAAAAEFAGAWPAAVALGSAPPVAPATTAALRKGD